MTKIIDIEHDVIISNLDEIVDIITKNIHLMDMDDNFLDLVLHFMAHTLAYKSMKQLKLPKNIQDECGLSFPDDFTREITKRTLNLDMKYRKYLGKLKNENSNKLLNKMMAGDNHQMSNYQMSNQQMSNQQMSNQQMSNQQILNQLNNDKSSDFDDAIDNEDDIDFEDIELESIFSNVNHQMIKNCQNEINALTTSSSMTIQHDNTNNV
jgi:hypothetical protein